MKFLNIFAFTLVIATSLQAQSTREIAFYNVENLFDTLDGANDDAEFLPAGKNAWNSARYNEKLDHINKVFDNFSNPLFIGMCEIENATVVRDVMKHSVKLNNYGLVHYESADARGVDVALIYDSSTMKLVESGYIRFSLPGAEARATRDIVWGKFSYKKETIIVMVNHWPSRGGGQEASEPNRLEAAKNARTFIDSLLSENKNAKIVFMGDLNDYPSNKAPQSVAEKLTPQITALSGDFGGSYNYKGEWDVLDHIMVSNGMINKKCKQKKSISLVPNSGEIHAFDFLLEEYKGQVVPFRTYGGSKYLGGYSDHLPVSIEVSLP
ncbi:MAG: hypothetical protein RLZ33_2483 [Bacteroidota bacterium]|jgi:predicted extracellular nuclease